jgi:hypothetical protein
LPLDKERLPLPALSFEECRFEMDRSPDRSGFELFSCPSDVELLPDLVVFPSREGLSEPAVSSELAVSFDPVLLDPVLALDPVLLSDLVVLSSAAAFPALALGSVTAGSLFLLGLLRLSGHRFFVGVSRWLASGAVTVWDHPESRWRPSGAANTSA